MTASIPDGKAEVLSWAVPEASRVAAPMVRKVLGSAGFRAYRNSTVPVGTPPEAVTLAVKVTDASYREGSELD
jgi:hypothetical protein